MTTYTNTSMIKAEHIKAIHKQLKQLGSKVEDFFLDGEEHALGNVLHLALGEGKFKVSHEDINNISTNEFKINIKI